MFLTDTIILIGMFIKAQDIELKFAQMIALPEPIIIKVADKHKFKFKMAASSKLSKLNNSRRHIS